MSINTNVYLFRRVCTHDVAGRMIATIFGRERRELCNVESRTFAMLSISYGRGKLELESFFQRLTYGWTKIFTLDFGFALDSDSASPRSRSI